MESQYKKILAFNRPAIVAALRSDITVNALVDILKGNVLTENEIDDVTTRRTNADKVRGILEHIERKPKIFHLFLEALRDPSVKAGDLSDLLNKDAGFTLSAIACSSTGNVEQQATNVQPANRSNNQVFVNESTGTAISSNEELTHLQSSEQMGKKIRKILAYSRPAIVAALRSGATVNALVDLLKGNVLTENEIDDVTTHRTNADKVRGILEHIERKPMTFKHFLEALRDPSVKAVDLSDLLNEDAGFKLSTTTDISTEGVVHVQQATNFQPTNSSSNQNFAQESTGTAISSDEATYPMSETNRGRCLIINNVRFQNDIDDRNGASFDFNALFRLFDSLNFEIWHETNITGKRIKTLLKEYSKPERHVDSSCFVCVIMSHGSEGVVEGIDGNKVIIEQDIIKKVQECKTLVEKPKIFLFQACRGGRHDMGVAIPLYVDSPAQQEATPHEATPLEATSQASHPEGELKLVPTDADVLIAYPTVKGNAAYRTNVGSWFIQYLVNVIRERHMTDHLVDMLTEVNRLMSARKGQINNQIVVAISNFTSTLTRRFYFKRPY